MSRRKRSEKKGKPISVANLPISDSTSTNASLQQTNDSSIEIADVPKQLPNEFKGVYYAVKTSDVFGAMGSWNDSPPCYAHEMGLDKEYNSLSDRLLQQIRYHLMYVTNECWKKTEA